jgi:hypothetical protein
MRARSFAKRKVDAGGRLGSDRDFSKDCSGLIGSSSSLSTLIVDTRPFQKLQTESKDAEEQYYPWTYYHADLPMDCLQSD